MVGELRLFQAFIGRIMMVTKHVIDTLPDIYDVFMFKAEKNSDLS